MPEQAKAAEAPEVGRPARLALAVDVTDNERRLIGQWLRSRELDGSVPAELLVAADSTFAARLQRHGDAGADALVIPVRVVWLPRERDGDRRTRWSDLVLLANPRRPGDRKSTRLNSSHT